MTDIKDPDDRVLDPSRRKMVHRGPEEEVRQAVIGFLTARAGIPVGLISVEKEIRRSSALYRADIVVYERDGRPWMVVECKAPGVEITQDTFDQIGSYNRFLNARYLLITNGQEHFCCEWNREEDRIVYLENLPSFPVI